MRINITGKMVLLSILFITVISAHLPAAEQNLHRVWAVKDCRIVTMTGSVIEKGSIVIRDGLIESVGINISIPADAEVIDGTGLTVYPGLIDTLNQSLIKLPQKEFDRIKILTGEYTDEDIGLTPELRSFDYVTLGKSAVEKYHKKGITAVMVMTTRGIFTGQSSFFSLGNEDKNSALILKDSWLGIRFSPSPVSGYPDSLFGVVAFLNQEFSDIAYFNMHKERWSKSMRGIVRPAYNVRYEEVVDYITGRKPVVFICQNEYDIRRAIQIGTRYNLKYLICDLGGEASEAIPELKKAKVGVLVTLAFKAPSTSIHAQLGKTMRDKAEKEIYPKNAAKLAEAGITFAFTSLETDSPDAFISGVQKSVESGLSREKALKALTVDAASIVGVSKALGTIEKGKIANLVITEGDLLTKEAKVKYVFADGMKFEIIEKKVKEGEKPTVNVSGKWELTFEGGASMKVTVSFIQEEANLSGTLSSTMGSYDFTGGAVVGNEIAFETTISAGGQDIDLFFAATVEGDTMRGNVVFGSFGSAEFKGRRIP